jgi:uncharacterized lipoprotein YddW (UPF0748 family)
MRGAWIATVANIDWPSTNAITTGQQKTELVAILDRAVGLKLNSVMFQVRPACDAFYSSALEPWSEYLTGTMGKTPEPFYDPLNFAIGEAHKRGLELHAWFNPYRARHLLARSGISPAHISRTHPEWVRQYGRFLWLDPGEKAVQDYSLAVVLDVVRRYDIDGVHFDDYFYPYSEKDSAGKELPFPDEKSWRHYGVESGLNREDWRRENVNVFVHRVYQAIKEAKPWVKFGISPFGIWRPGNPAQIQGTDAFAKLYADSRKWLQNGWVDYLAPQLYWEIEKPATSFPVLLKWWAEQNPKGRQLFAGLDATRTLRGSEPWKPGEIIKQIRISRQQAGVNGDVLWNMGTLMRNTALDSALEADVYTEPALVPATPWLDAAIPPPPKVTIAEKGHKLDVTWSAEGEGVRSYVIQTRQTRVWRTVILPGGTKNFVVERSWPEVLSVMAIDRCGNASKPAVFERAD